jgi:hypothetical protein
LGKKKKKAKKEEKEKIIQVRVSVEISLELTWPCPTTIHQPLQCSLQMDVHLITTPTTIIHLQLSLISPLPLMPLTHNHIHQQEGEQEEEAPHLEFLLELELVTLISSPQMCPHQTHTSIINLVPK